MSRKFQYALNFTCTANESCFCSLCTDNIYHYLDEKTFTDRCVQINSSTSNASARCSINGLWHEPWFADPGFQQLFYLNYYGYLKCLLLWMLARYRKLINWQAI